MFGISEVCLVFAGIARDALGNLRNKTWEIPLTQKRQRMPNTSEIPTCQSCVAISSRPCPNIVLVVFPSSSVIYWYCLRRPEEYPCIPQHLGNTRNTKVWHAVLGMSTKLSSLFMSEILWVLFHIVGISVFWGCMGQPVEGLMGDRVAIWRATSPRIGAQPTEDAPPPERDLNNFE